jgi:ABC-type phosphate/phosphonate transport system substrate-binding protein
MRRLGLCAALAASMMAMGCGKKDGDAQGVASGATLGGSGDAASASKLVPAELAAQLSFEDTTLDDGIHAAVPAGWQSHHIPGMYKPGDDSLGFMTRFSVGTNCDGACQPKDWAAVADKVDFAQFTDGHFTVDKDDKSDGHRLLIARSDDKVYITEAWWRADLPRYLSCSVSLDGPAAKARDAFVAACAATALK